MNASREKADEPGLNFSTIANFVGVTEEFEGELFKFWSPAPDGSDEGLPCQEVKTTGYNPVASGMPAEPAGRLWFT